MERKGVRFSTCTHVFAHAPDTKHCLDTALSTKRHVRNSTPPRIHSSPQKTKHLHSMNSHTPEVQCGAMHVECTYTFTFNKLHVLTLLRSPGARKRAHDGGLASSSPSCGRRAERGREGTNLNCQVSSTTCTHSFTLLHSTLAR